MIIQINDEFDPAKIIASGQCFRPAVLTDGTIRFMTCGHVLHMKQMQDSTYNTDADAETWQNIWRPYFDADRNYAAIRSSIPDTDAFLTKCGEYSRGIRILRQDPWETLISFIISQRKSIPAIRKCIEEICRNLGRNIQTPYGSVHTFPDAHTLYECDERILQACGTGYRLSYIRDAAKRVAEGSLDLDGLNDADTDTILRELQSVHGVGIKVANCVLLFAYGRTGAVPVDTWIRRIIDEKYAGTDPFRAYGVSAGIMQQYAFYYAINHRSEFN